MALTLSSSTPSSGATDWYINKSLEVTFNKALDSSTLTDNVIYLYDTSSNINVPISIERKSTDTTTVIITPVVALKENTSYRLSICGTDSALGEYLKASDLDTLTVTVTILFSTGDNVYSIDSTIEKNASAVTLEGDIFLPANITALGYEFTINSVSPKNHSHGITGSLTGVNFTFSKSLLTGQDLTQWATVDVYPLLVDNAYLASGSTMDLGSGDITIPDYTITSTGSVLSVTWPYGLPKNAIVAISLNTNIKSSDNEQYAGNMKYSVTTELYPTAFGPALVKTELPALANLVYDDYIGTLLFKNSIFLWEKLGRSIDLSNLSFPAKKYILMSTVLDIIEDRDYRKFIVAGTRRQLGDLNVSVDNLIGRLALKVARAKEEKELALETLKAGWQFKKIGYLTFDSEFLGTRLWYNVNSVYVDPLYKYYQTDLPGSNVSINRQAKTNNPVW